MADKNSIILKITKVRGGFQLQAPSGAVSVCTTTEEIGPAAVEMLEEQPEEVIVEPVAGPAPQASGEHFGSFEEPFAELQGKAVQYLENNGERLIKDGLSFLRSISRDAPKDGDQQ